MGRNNDSAERWHDKTPDERHTENLTELRKAARLDLLLRACQILMLSNRSYSRWEIDGAFLNQAEQIAKEIERRAEQWINDPK